MTMPSATDLLQVDLLFVDLANVIPIGPHRRILEEWEREHPSVREAYVPEHLFRFIEFIDNLALDVPALYVLDRGVKLLDPAPYEEQHFDALVENGTIWRTTSKRSKADWYIGPLIDADLRVAVVSRDRFRGDNEVATTHVGQWLRLEPQWDRWSASYRLEPDGPFGLADVTFGGRMAATEVLEQAKALLERESQRGPRRSWQRRPRIERSGRRVMVATKRRRLDSSIGVADEIPPRIPERGLGSQEFQTIERRDSTRPSLPVLLALSLSARRRRVGTRVRLVGRYFHGDGSSTGQIRWFGSTQPFMLPADFNPTVTDQGQFMEVEGTVLVASDGSWRLENVGAARATDTPKASRPARRNPSDPPSDLSTWGNIHKQKQTSNPVKSQGEPRTELQPGFVGDVQARIQLSPIENNMSAVRPPVVVEPDGVDNPTHMRAVLNTDPIVAKSAKPHNHIWPIVIAMTPIAVGLAYLLIQLIT